MRDHFIPKFYLKGFTESPDVDLLWVYEKGRETPFRSSVENIGLQTKFYSREIEQFLANDVENPANEVLRRIRNRFTLSTLDKEHLSNYMMVMWKRVPQHKTWVKDKSPEIISAGIDRIEKELDELKNRFPEKSSLIEKRKKEIRDIVRIKKSELIHGIWLDNIPPGRTPKSVEALSMMTWRFQISENNQLFVCSDNPLFFFSWMGIGNERSEVSFPISRYICLWATWRKDLEEGYFPTRTQVIKELNRRTVYSATRFVYSSTREEWIPSVLKKKRIRLNQIL